MLQIRSYRSRLQTAFVLLGLTAIAVTGWETSQGAATALRTATYERLTAIAETKRRTVERYFEDVGNHVLALSADESTITALEQFQAAWETIPPRRAPSGELEAIYGGQARAWMPSEPRTLALQHAFLAANPHPEGSRQQLLTAPSVGRYSDVHARFHPTLHRYQSAFGFYDIFLIEPTSGRLDYTVLKEIDLGMRLADPPYNATSLARAFRRAMEVEEPETFVVEDYEPYVASSFAPAAFFAAPIWRRGVKVGVLAIQVSVAHLNSVMTSDRNWRDEGLGETGQSYLVGPDGTLRSDVRSIRGDLSGEVVEKIRRHKTAVLNLKIPDELARSIRAGEHGTHAGHDPRGVEVLRTHVPLRIPGVNWTLIAEIDSAEALAPVRSMQGKTLLWGVVVAVLFFVAAAWLARSVTRPVLALADKAAQVGRGDFDARMPVDSDDEVGRLASAFNRMAEDLRRTTVSKAELEVLAGRLISAQEEERTRVGRELHDDLTQRLAALSIVIGRLVRQVPESPLREHLTDLRQEVIQLSRDVHGLSRRLHPAMLDDLGLVAAVESECRGFFERGGPPVRFSAEGSFEDVSRDAQLALYRIVQEGLRNIQRHSDAEDVEIRLGRSGANVELSIEDNGLGFNRGDKEWRAGLGLASMEERARLLGGECTIASKLGQGTRISVRLPAGEADGQTENTVGR